MKPIKAAIVGAANFGKFRRDRMRETGLFTLLGSYDLNPEAMKQAETEDGARPCESFDALLALPGLEAVVISTGAKFHAEQALAAMAKGLHVFIEKPLCSTMDEVNALYAAQKKMKVKVGLGHQDHRGDPICKLIKDYLSNGKIGKLAAVEYNSSHSGGLAGDPASWRFDPAKNPGGMLFQCGVHALHELMYLFGPVIEVSAMMRYDVHVTKTADVAQTLLRFESGLLGNLNCYHVTGYNHMFRLFGTAGNLSIDTFAKKAWYQERKCGDAEIPVAVELPTMTEKEELAHRCGNVISFAEAVRGKTELNWPGLNEGARSVAVVFGCDESARTGRVVPITLPS